MKTILFIGEAIHFTLGVLAWHDKSYEVAACFLLIAVYLRVLAIDRKNK